MLMILLIDGLVILWINVNDVKIVAFHFLTSLFLFYGGTRHGTKKYY